MMPLSAASSTSQFHLHPYYIKILAKLLPNPAESTTLFKTILPVKSQTSPVSRRYVRQ
jgi:hypothetical protein